MPASGDRPRWTTNVYPLYYLARQELTGAGGEPSEKQTYEFVRDICSRHFPDGLTSLAAGEVLSHMTQVANSEIDLLIEDLDYFVFIEAKFPPPGARASFRRIDRIHQLVRQYVQGRILAKLTSKSFALATIGANGGTHTTIRPNSAESALLGLIGEPAKPLDFLDLTWPRTTSASLPPWPGYTSWPS